MSSRRIRALRSPVTTAVVLGVAVSAIQAAEPPPNLLFLMVDDLGKDWIGCYGADDIQTPHIDRLAAEGLRFDCAWSMPQCTPTRVTLLTGQYPWRTGWVNHWDVPRWGVGYFEWEQYTTFATLLRDAGYATAIAGKWQINDFRLAPDALDRHGFDEWCVWTGYETLNPPSGRRYWDPYLHTREGSRRYDGDFGPDLFCSFLIDFLRRHREEPLLLYFPLALTHGPLIAPPSAPEAETPDQKHRAMVRHVDLLVGRLMQALEDLGLADRTAVFFTTDNGTSRGLLGSIQGRKLRGGKGAKFESGVCAPFLVRAPDLGTPVGVTDALIDFTDLLPTFCDLARIPVPEHLAVDGHSFAGLLRGETDQGPREWILALGHGPARLDERGVRGQHDYASRVIRTARHKAWVSTEREITELYDLAEDPDETRNLLEEPDADVETPLRTLQAVVDAMPAVDARPLYRSRARNAWDRER